MKVLGICGSPRKNGNSTTLLQEALRGAKDNNADVSILHVSDLNIHHCIHCDNCIKNGSCCFNDDMEIVLKKLSECDILFISSPLHFGNVSSQLKVLIDRMQLLWAHKYVLKTPLLEPKNRKCVFISTAMRKGSDIFDGSLITVKDFLFCADITLNDTLLFNGLDNANDAQNNLEIMKKCYETGQGLTK